jgi:hypothetical protein
MRDRIRVDSHGPDRTHRAGVVGCVNGVGQKKLRLTLGCIHLDWQNHRCSDQDPSLSWLGNNKRPLLNAISAPKRSRDYDRSSLADTTGLSGDRRIRSRCLDRLRGMRLLLSNPFGPSHARSPLADEGQHARLSDIRAHAPIVRIDQPEIKAVNRRGPSNGSTIQEPARVSGLFARPNWDMGYGESDAGGRWS